MKTFTSLTTKHFSLTLLLITTLSVSSCSNNYFFHPSSSSTTSDKAIHGGALQARKSVYLPNFHHVNNTTSAEIQLFTDTVKPLLVMSGNQAGISNIVLTVDNDTLLLEEKQSMSQGNKVSASKDKTVKIKLHVPSLQNIANLGSGTIYGRPITSHHSVITTKNLGALVLSGNLDIKQLNTNGDGTVFIEGVHSKSLEINDHSAAKVTLSGQMNVKHLHTDTSGSLSISGKVQASSIDKQGNGKLTINGLSSHNLNVKKSGDGDVFLAGDINLYQLQTGGNSDVVISGIHSKLLDVHAGGKGDLRLIGQTTQLFAELRGEIKFIANNLMTKTAFVQLNNQVEGYVNVTDAMSVHTNDQSHLYYRGSPKINTEFVDASSSIIRYQA